MRSLKWKGATVAIIVIASGAAAGQTPSRPGTVVQRLLSFDADSDNRIARDELPERMEGLFSRGDKNNDGFLTPDEVAALVSTASTARPIQQLVVRDVGTLADIVADLKLSPVTHDRAMTILKSHLVPHQINVTKELDAAMRELLDAEDYDNFVAAATRFRNTRRVFIGAPPPGPLRRPITPVPNPGARMVRTH